MANSSNVGIPPDIIVVSYNVDGLDTRARATRFLGVLTVLAKINPEIIFLQEVIDTMEEKMREILGKMYNIFTGCTGTPYYVVTAISKNIKIEKSEVIDFSTSMMGRNMLCVEAKWHDLNIRLLNTHLESGSKASIYEAAERCNQFKQGMAKLTEYLDDSNTLAIFGGDLNIRDTEVPELPPGVQDAWVAAGSEEIFKNTWDTALNDNITSFEGKKFKPRLRFDRLYIKSPYTKTDFFLEGKQRIKTTNLFPSDHFAIVCKLSAPKID